MNFNFADMMKNLGPMQAQMEEMQKKIQAMTAQGSSGGDMVKVEINGKMEMLSIEIDPLAVDPRDVAMLQELILSAHRGAMEKMQEQLQAEMGSMLPGMGGFGL